MKNQGKRKDSIGNEDYKIELLDLLKSLSPSGFERLSQRLLREAGFQNVVVTGKSGDGGIDGVGILQINPLVSFKVMFQCKRFQKSVSASQIRDFRGTILGRAEKGIFITTGSFTSSASEEARREGVIPIELVDGEKLVDMFEKLEIGLRPVKTYEVIQEFFEPFRV
ncbi:MAG: restriction endonuclease [Melioribacteraceae bacterium]|nr:restriction endonuclease [Melioribacteraceae bacterium]